jgi:hypothetical protein
VTTERTRRAEAAAVSVFPQVRIRGSARTRRTDLITAIEPTGNLVAQIVTQTERLLRGTSRLAAPDLVRRHPRAYRPFLHIPAQDHHGIEART